MLKYYYTIKLIFFLIRSLINNFIASLSIALIAFETVFIVVFGLSLVSFVSQPGENVFQTVR